MEPSNRKDWSNRIVGKLEIGVIVSLLIAASSAIFSYAVVYTTVQQHDRDIIEIRQRHERDVMEIRQQESSVTDRLARIETKLDLLVAGASPGRKLLLTQGETAQ